MTTAAHATAEGAGWLLPAVLVTAPGLAYCAAVRVRRRAGRRWPPWRTASFLVGLLFVAVAVSPPLRELAHADPRGHMGQHMLLGMFAPLALVLAAPGTLVLGALPVAVRRSAGRVLRNRLRRCLVHPASAGVLDVGALYLLYLTPLHTLAHDSVVVHYLVLVHFLLAGYFFTWSIAGPDPAPGRPGLPTRVAVLIIAAAAHGYLAKLLYVRAGELQAAAQLMYYGGDIAELALAVALFAAWYNKTLEFPTGSASGIAERCFPVPRRRDRQNWPAFRRPAADTGVDSSC